MPSYPTSAPTIAQREHAPTLARTSRTYSGNSTQQGPPTIAQREHAPTWARTSRTYSGNSTQQGPLQLPRGDLCLPGQGQAGHTQVILRSRAHYNCPEGTCAYLGKDKQDILRQFYTAGPPYYCPEGTCAYLGKDKQDILRQFYTAGPPTIAQRGHAPTWARTSRTYSGNSTQQGPLLLSRGVMRLHGQGQAGRVVT